MKTRYTPYFIDLIYDALLKSFWRKRALRKFLRECSISESFLSTWSSDETKREFLDRLFGKLLANDRGRIALDKMSLFLIEQKTFPDLQNWEDSALKIREAHIAVERLKVYYNKQGEEIENLKEKEEARERFSQIHEAISKSQKTLQKLNDQINALLKRIGTQEAGYEFQDWFYDLLDFSEIINRKPYTSQGRQIDGSLTLSDTTYLVELKFTSNQSGVNEIDSFYKKITSKADNTMGIMVSISGYSSVAIQEASGDKTPILLIDYRSLYYVLSGIMGMADLIGRIRRHASQTGEAYLSPENFNL